MYQATPSQRDLASRAKISTKYARKVIIELTNTGSLSDPEVTNSDRIREKEKVLYLAPAEELFLLALHAEKPARPMQTTWHSCIHSMVPWFWFRSSPSGSTQGLTTKALFESQILSLSTSFDKKM
jgi:hypothetical protein